MDIGQALAIFNDINYSKFDNETKVAAIKKVVAMPTHNSVKKDTMLEVIHWLLDTYIA